MLQIKNSLREKKCEKQKANKVYKMGELDLFIFVM